MAGCGLCASPEHVDATLTTRSVANESCVLAVPASHRLVGYDEVSISDFCHEPVIIPERRTRPHSHDLTMHAFRAAANLRSLRSTLRKNRPS